MEALNKRFALVLWAEDEQGEEDVAVFSGTLIKEGNLYFLQRRSGQGPEIREEWLERIKPVDDELKETLMGCEFQLSLSVGKAISGQVLESFGGLKWPE
ncbi:hypothetical protein [Zhongshania sp.]|uniref:hypothetical protein n=1 Tax=Zhongshania sp. TaxID=1971902 RepID=UPI001B5024C3|nr:hypothetical protein [Zhongshania sp.]MBQ0797088.1 hypothetical protein [Zhongshania sp.]